MTAALKAPFPYFGGKSRIVDLVWQRFGAVANYCEPFFGSGTVLLGCPRPGHTETVNDIDALLANFWRALQHDPEQTAYYADHPVDETDLHARHKWLVRRKPEIQALLDSDPDAYDSKAAGWWVWGISCWIGSGWCAQTGAGPRQAPHLGDAGMGTHRKMPHVGDAGRGGHRAQHGELWEPRPFLSHDGQGIHRKRPHLLSRKGVHSADASAVNPSRQLPELGSDRGGRRDLSRKMPHVGAGWRGTEQGEGVHRASLSRGGIYGYFEALATRLRRVRVCCGDWRRVLGPSVTFRHGLSAIFLDPPYLMDSRATVYAFESDTVAHDVQEWAVLNGDNPLLRIALCGYEGHYDMPEGWDKVAWKTPGGYGSQGNGQGQKNRLREVVWFSPHCLKSMQLVFEL